MQPKYKPLPSKTLQYNITHCQPPATLFTLTKNDPAIMAMTDFRTIRAVTTRPETSITACNNHMIMNNVRLLLITDNNREVQGVLTAADILGEKPLSHIQRTGGRRDEILARDIMTPTLELKVLSLNDVEDGSVGDIIETLLKDGRQHAIVTCDYRGKMMLCGMFSATQIGKQLGITIEPVTMAKSFAELERAIVA
jgi:CBS-domain-containing membrane protein